jgi:DNA helicase-2/ATP-dependent DNA helicase PcrA
MALSEFAALVLEEAGYTAMWQHDKSPEAPGRLDNLREFATGLEAWDTLGAFLDHVSLVMENEANAGDAAVSLMTLHGAKGLEFDAVFLPGWEEEIFPNRRALDETGQKALEEERRLAYVGLTRARLRVFISFAANRRVFNQWQSSLPSRFIDELPKEHVRVQSDTGYFNSRNEGLSEGWQPPSFQPSWGSRTRPPVVESQWEEVPVERRGTYAKGDRVFHQKFGYGRVTAVEEGKLEIAFDKAGVKRVLDSFVTPA